jgi:hypothetical protein
MTILIKDRSLQSMIGQKVAGNGVIVRVSRVNRPNGTTVLFVVDKPVLVAGRRVMQIDHLSLSVPCWSKLNQRLIRVGQRVAFEGIISNYERANGTIGTGIPELAFLVGA